MSAEADLAHCREAIRHGSLSFHAASKLLPRRARDPALALYAFCRLADDAVDLHEDKTAAVLALRDRLDRAYAGCPLDRPADRAFARMVATHDMPRALPEALLEGFAWDAMERRYASLSEVRAYGARVAGTVGAMMCVLMGVRDADALARACDMGVAMQLTNISRDLGEDAAAGRLYLPTDWFAEAGLDPDAWLADPRPCPEIAEMTRRLLAEAERLYFRAEAGVAALPVSCRPGIFAARIIYGAIGGHVARAGHDSVTRRARTGAGEKLAGIAGALALTGVSLVWPRSAVLHAGPLDETGFLVAAAAARTRGEAGAWGSGRSGALVALFAELEARDRARRSGLEYRDGAPT